MPKTLWGAAIVRLLAERGWSQRRLAKNAPVQPNTLTNLIKHGGQSDTATLERIARALGVETTELFLTQEQSMILRAYDEIEIERIRMVVMKELSPIVTDLIRQELARSKGSESPAGRAKTKSRVPSGKRKKPRSD